MNGTPSPEEGLSGEGLCVRYEANPLLIIDGQSIAIPEGKITALIGPNGSGKSTLLKTLARQLHPAQGRVILDGKNIADLPIRQFAQMLGILFQENVAPGDLTVEQLVWHGRYPHRRLFDSLSDADQAAVEEALKWAGLESLRHRPMNQLSAGQRQLAWIGMALSQSPRYLFLDEPTTFLDLAHQFDVMDLLSRLNRNLGKTIVIVVHDLNLAAHYADHLFAIRDGEIIASGATAKVLTVETLRRVFDVETRIILDEEGKILFCAPLAKSVDR